MTKSLSIENDQTNKSDEERIAKNLRKRNFQCSRCSQVFKTGQGWFYHQNSSRCSQSSPSYNIYNKNGYIYKSPFDLQSEGSELETIEAEASLNYVSTFSMKSERIKRRTTIVPPNEDQSLEQSNKKSSFSIKYDPKATNFVKKRVPLTYAEAQNIVEFEHQTDGYRRLLIDEKIDFVSDSLIDDQYLVNEENISSKATINYDLNRFDSPKKSNFTNKITLFTSNSDQIIKQDSIKTDKYHVTARNEEKLFSIRHPITSRDDNFFFRLTMKHLHDVENRVEYDVDEEDINWLNIINANLSCELSVVKFECIIDHLERISMFKGQYNGTQQVKSHLEVDEDAVCSVCNDDDCSNCNAILFCDMCNLAVHQDCYGVPYIPEGQWLCRKCLHSPSRPVSCSLCHSLTGAFKKTSDDRWTHVVCALYIPEVRFANPVFLEPVEGVESIPLARRRLLCSICKIRGGACIQCSKENCYAAFHVTCSQNIGNFLKLELTNNSSCDSDNPANPNLDSNLVKRISYCSVHSSNYKKDNSKRNHLQDFTSNTDKKLSDVDVSISVHIPIITDEQLDDIIERFNLSKILAELIRNYWIIKRFMRNGVPLLRRLQFNSYVQTETSNLLENIETDIKNSQEFEEMVKNRGLILKQMHEIRKLVDLIHQRESNKLQLCHVNRKLLNFHGNHPFMSKIIQFYSYFNSLVTIKSLIPHYLETANFINLTVITDFNGGSCSSCDNLGDDIFNNESLKIDKSVQNLSLNDENASGLINEHQFSSLKPYLILLNDLKRIFRRMEYFFNKNKTNLSLKHKIELVDHQSYSINGDKRFHLILNRENLIYDHIKIKLIIPNEEPSTIDAKKVVWAKCFYYPPYPGLVHCSSQTYIEKKSSIPKNVRRSISPKDSNEYLIQFFDQRSTWQWIPRNKIELLATDRRLDMYNLMLSSKYSDALMAYHKAIEFIQLSSFA